MEWISSYNLGNFVKNKEFDKLEETIYLKDNATGIVSSAKIKFQIDKTSPTGEVTVETNLIKSFLNYISFGFFFKDNMEFHFTAEDTGSGVASIEYVQLSKEQIEKCLESGSAPTIKAEDWQKANSTDLFIINGEKGNDYVFYVKITDYVGNVVSFSTSGVALDEALKVIVDQSQLEYRNGSKKYGNPKLYASLKDNEIQKIEINGVEVGYEIDNDNIYLTDKETLEDILDEVTTLKNPSADVNGVVYYYPKGHGGNPAAVATANFTFKFKQLIPLQNVTFVPNAGIVDSTRVYDGIATEDYEVVPGAGTSNNTVKDLIFNSVKVDGVANDRAVLQVKKFVDGEYVDVETMKNVGEYKLYMLVPETETHCYYEADISGAIYKITPKTLTVESLKAIDREYKPGGQGGYRVNFEKKLTLIGVVGNDKVYGTPYTSTYEWMGNIGSCNAGEYEVEYDVYLDGTAAANYQIKELPTVKVNITPCVIRVNVGFKDESKFAKAPSSTSEGMEYTFWRGAFCGLELKEYENGKLYSNPHPQDGISVTGLKVSWNIDPFLVGYDANQKLIKQDLVATIEGKINDGNGNYVLESSVNLGKVKFIGANYALYSNSHDIAIADLTNNSKTHYINYYEHGALIFVGHSAEGYQVSNDYGENFYNMIIYTHKDIKTVDDLTALEAYKKLYKDNIISSFKPVLTGKDQNCLIVKLDFGGFGHKILDLGQEDYHSICVKNLGGGLDEPEKDRTTDEFKFKVLLDNEPVKLKSQKLGIDAKEIKENTASYYYIQNSTQITNGIVMDLEVEVGESGIGSAKLWDGVNKDSTLNGYSSSTSNANDPSKIQIIDDGVADGIANIRITLAANSPLLGKPLYFNATNRAYNYLADKEGTIEEHEKGHLLGYIIVNNDPPSISATYGETLLGTEVKSFNEKQNLTVTLSHEGGFKDLEGFAEIVTTLNGNTTTHVSSDVKGSQTVTIAAESLKFGENTIVVTATDLCGNTATATYTFVVRKAQDTVTISGPASVTYGDSLSVDKYVLSGGSANLIADATYEIVDGEGVATLNGRTITLHKAGTFKIKAKVPGNSEYLPTEVTTSVITVAKRVVSISGLKAVNKVYNGDTVIDLNGEAVVYNNVLSTEAEAFKSAVVVPKKGTSNSANAGDRTVTVPAFTFVDGSPFAEKYELASYGTVSVNIAKRPLQLVVTGSNYGTGNNVEVNKGTYTSKINLIVALAPNSGLVESAAPNGFELPTVDVSGLDLMTVQSGKSVKLPFVANSGNATANYTFENTTVTINLTVKSVAVKAEFYSINGTLANGWYTSDVTITPAEPYDKISQGSVFDTTANSDKIDLRAEGIHNLLISLRDENDLGTIADGGNLVIKIDKTAPTIGNVLYGTAHEINNTYYVNNGAVTITANVTDSVSKVANVFFVYGGEEIPMTLGTSNIYSVTLSAEGTYNGKIVAVDNAGHKTEVTCATILVEKAAPVISTSINGTEVSNEYYEQAPTVSVQVSDNGSGLKSVKYTVNGGTEQTVTIVEGNTSAAFDITTLTQGVNNISIIATDRAGNTTTYTTTVKVTKNQGALSVSLSPIDVVSSGKYTYGDTYKVIVDQGPDVTNGALTYVSTNPSVAEVDAYGNVTIVGVGEFEITVTKAATTGYFYTTVTTQKFATVQRPVTITGFDAYDRPYDTTVGVNLYTNGASLVGLANFTDEASKVSFGTLPRTGTMTDANVGTGKAVSFTTIVLEGAKADCYVLTQPEITVDITPVVLNVSVKDVEINKGQNITKLELVISGFLTGDSEESLGDEFVRPTVSIDGEVDTMNAATNWFKVAYTGGDASDNYTFNYDETVNLKINKVYIQREDYAEKEDKNLTVWNKDGLVIIPVGDYKEISLDGKNWAKELSLTEGNSSVTFCLRHEDGSVTETISINYKLDTTAPTVEFYYNSKLFQDGLRGIVGQIYNLFFKDNLNITLHITEELSGIVKKQYQVVEGTTYSNNESDWTNYVDAVGITAKKKAVVYVRLEDAAGNVSILNSEGVVVYQDSAASNVDVTYTKTTLTDLALGITFNDNTIAGVKLDGRDLTNSEYVVTTDGIEISNEILDGLTAGLHYVEVSYNPLGVAYVEGNINERPETTVFNVTVKLAQLTVGNLGFIAPENLVYDGNAKEANVTCNVNGIGNITVKYYDEKGNVVEAPTNVGKYTVKASVTAGDVYGALAETEVGSFTITAKELTIKDLVAENREYNGSTSVVLKGGTLVGICGNDDVTPVIPATGTLVDANAAKGKPVSVVKITLDGEDALNYTLKQPTGITVDISKVTLSVSVNPVEIKKGQAIPTLTVSVTGFVNGENTSLAGFKAPTATPVDGVDTKNKDLKVFDVVYSGGTPTDNYVFDLTNTRAQITIVTVEANIVITPADLTGWINGDITITPGTGFDLISKDGVNWYPSITLSTSGDEEVVIYTMNSSDDTLSEAKTVSYKIDKESPIIGAVTLPSGVVTTVTDKIIYDKEFDVNVAVSDAHSDVAEVTYKLHYADGRVVSEDAILALKNNSKYAIIEVPEGFVGTISMVVKDNVGNIKEAILENGKTFIADTVAPEIDITLNGEAVEDGDALKCTDTIDVAATDSASGIKKVTYYVNGVETSAINFVIGTNTVKVVAEDYAGNETVKTVTITVSHNWNSDPEFTWTNDYKATATFTCGHDEDHKETKECTVTSVTEAATCEEDGETVYTAKVTFEGKEYTATKTVELEKLGHAYDTHAFVWDGTAATVVFTCTNNASHTVTKACTVTSVTTDATCEEDGETVYTAKVTFEDVEYTGTKSVIIPKLGHAYGEPEFTWTNDYKATATFTCGHDESHKETKECTVTSVTEAATCEEDGETVYTAKVTFEGKEYTATKTVELEKLGHAYDTHAFVWDGTAATIVFTCTNNASHTVTKACTVTSVTTDATCEEDGETVYTAKVTFEDVEYTGTKSVIIPKLGHVYGEPEFTWTNDYKAIATFTCGNNASHKETKECTVTSVTEAATCEEDGETVYTAKVTFEGKEYTATKTVELEKLGHAYGTPVFTWVGTTATATVTCGNNEAHVIVLEVEVAEETTEATCTDAGAIVYTATATFEGVEYTDVKVVEIPALGHDWVIGMDEENHWKECDREDCTEVKEEAALALEYVSNNNASMLQNATETATCHCGYTHTREIPNTMIKEEMEEEVLEEETVGSGSISTQINKDEELPKTEIDNLTTDVAKDLLTEKELQKVEEGATILVYLDVRNADETAPKKDKDETEKHVEKHVQDGKVGMYLDLSLFKKVGDDAASKVTNTEGNLIEITIEVPQNLTNHNPHVTRTFYIVRVHDGVAEIISEGTTASTITFKTDKFSTYAVVYSDVDTSEKAPVTGDATSMYWYMMLMVVGLGVFAVGTKKQRR